MKVYSVLVVFEDGRRTYVDAKGTDVRDAESKAVRSVREAGMDGVILSATAMTH